MILSISLKTEQIEHCPNYPLLAELYMVYACADLVGWGTRGGGVQTSSLKLHTY